MKLLLETFSPLHIGAGERYSGSEFIVKSNEMMRVDINKIYALLDEKNKQIFLDSLEDPFFRLNDFVNKIKIPVSEAKLYSSSLKTNIPIEIIEHIKTGFKGYIPGSSFKGAIRTAILSAFIGEKEVNELGKIFTMKNPWQMNREAERFIDGFFSSGTNRDPNIDFMRFIQISDFIPVKNLCIYNIQSLEAGEKNWKWYHRNGRVVQSYLETIAAGEQLEGEMHLTYKNNIHQSLGLQGKKDIINIIEIKRLIYNFSSNIIEHEIKFSERYNINFLLEFYENLKKVNKADSPVIKLGNGSGYLATTIGLEIKKNPVVYEIVRNSLRGRSYAFEFPKSRRIVMEEKMPLGWCRLI